MMTALLDHLWQSTLVALAAALLAVLLRGNGAHVRYWIWFAASIKFLIPFSALIALGTALGPLNAPWPSSGEAWFVERVAQPAALTSSAPAAPALAQPVGDDGSAGLATIAIAGIWMLGVVIVLGTWLARWRRLRRLVLAAKPVHIALDLGTIPLKIASWSVEPGVFGIFKPVLVVPENMLERLTAPQLRAVLTHEMCHVRRRDNLTAAVHMLVEALFWFHPLVWWIGARLLDERERACDEAVLAAGVEPDVYAEGILEVCRHCIESPLPCVPGIGGGRALRARVQRIAHCREILPLTALRKAMLATATGAVLALPIGIGVVHAPTLRAQEAQDPLDRYVGYYGVPEINWIVRVEREDDHLVVHENAKAPMAVYPRSETEFFAMTTDAEVEFVDQDGVRVFVLRPGIRAQATPMWGVQLDSASAEAQLADLQERVDEQTPAPGTEEILRRIARVLAGEETLPAEPVDGDFDPARAIRDALERDLPDAFAARGALDSVSFASVSSNGNDVYEVAFENLAIEIMIGMTDESTVASLNYRPTRRPGL